ncbi:MAG: DUF21 domain-containing protein [Proteobacteria bacterium]|nr:DUF21 domain-containing protein [Pseudomonadota bacterium]
MSELTITELTWVGIVFCLSQSAMFSGLNLAFFSVGRLQLEVESKTNKRALKILEMRRDSNFLLTTILWGNVSINVLLTLLTDSVMSGLVAFAVSTCLITFFGEITPQAYFSRNSVNMASALAPVLRLYQFILYPVAKPSAILLDIWLGRETPQFLRETSVRELLLRHVEASDSELDHVEGTGAANFLTIDDLTAWDEGEDLAPASIIALPTDVDLPRIPPVESTPGDPFLRKVHASNEKWVILTNLQGEPLLALDADSFLRAALFDPENFKPYTHCHRPVIVKNEPYSLGWVIRAIAHGKRTDSSGVVIDDVVLLWGKTPRIITGADILGRLLTGI